MPQSKNITRAFENALRLAFDDNSKFALMSDCHRSDGSFSDNFMHNRNLVIAALKHYYNNGFTYIELGDGDELWENKKFATIARDNEEIFKLLSKFHNDKRLYLIYGNHDFAKKINPRIYEAFAEDLFPNIAFYEAVVLRQKYTKEELFLLHGHQADFFNYTLWRAAKYLVRYLWKPLELIGVKDPFSPKNNLRKKGSVEQNLASWAAKNRRLLIAGHTHRAAFPSAGQSLYVNDGCCVNSYNITAVEIASGEISLVEWSAKTRGDGVLYIGRDVINAPVKIAEFFKT